MSSQTHILGKDATLEDSIESMTQKLQSIGFNIIEQSWLNPIANVWSVHIRDRDCPLLFTNGKGSSKKAALASALGEFFERLSTHYFWADYYLGDDITNRKAVHYSNERWFPISRDGSWPEDLLNDELLEFYNPDGTLNIHELVDTNSANQQRGICALPYLCERTQKITYFPVNIIGNLYVSNGMSAGNTLYEARVQALSEILERFIKFKIIAEEISLPDVPLEVLEQYPNIQEGIKELEDAGYGILVQDASLGGNYPVMVVTLLHPENQGVFASFGAHPKFEVALERALTELLQGRALESLSVFPEAGFNQDEIASPQNLETHFIDSSGIVSWEYLKNEADFDFVHWGTDSKNTEEEYRWLCESIHSEGNDIYITDYQQLGIYACRILVPGISEIYPSDDLIWENNNQGIHFRKAILASNKSPEACLELVERLEELNHDDQLLVTTFIGLPADKDSIFSDLRMAELITLLSLKGQDSERVQEGIEWLLHFRQINPQRLKTYQCIHTLLQLEGMSRYGTALHKLYGEKTVNDALSLIDGENIFPLESNWKMHGLLIEAYNKLTI